MSATLTITPRSLMTDHVSSRAGTPNTPPAGAANALTSVELLARAQGGDELALNELFARYLPRLRRWAHGRLPLSARLGLKRWTGRRTRWRASCRTWRRSSPCTTAASTATFGYRSSTVFGIRSRGRNGGQPIMPASDHLAADPSPLEEAIGAEALHIYEQALKRLPDADRKAIVLRIELRLPYPRDQIGRNNRQSIQCIN